MEGGMVFDNSTITVMPPSSDVLNSLWISNSSTSFHGCTAMVNFENPPTGETTTTVSPFLTPLDKEEKCGDEDYDRCFHQPEKKRRLTVDQVQFLERSFEVENKLEPERKVELAKELNLQPRQVAIWFQNRRARYKSKQIEKDYGFLKASYDKLKLDCDSLQKENEKLKHQVHLLTEKLVHREKKRKEDLGPCEATTNPMESQTQKTIPITISQNVINVPTTMVVCKQEDANSAKSDVFDSESPHYTDGNHSSFLEPADSSHVFEPDHSEFSQDEEDNFSRGLLCDRPHFPKIEDESYIDPSVSSCNLGYPVDDQPFWLWP